MLKRDHILDPSATVIKGRCTDCGLVDEVVELRDQNEGRNRPWLVDVRGPHFRHFDLWNCMEWCANDKAYIPDDGECCDD